MMAPSVTASIPIFVATCVFFVNGGLRTNPEGSEGTLNALHAGAANMRNRRIFTDVHYGGHGLAEVFVDRYTGRLLHCNVLGDRIAIKHFLTSASAPAVTHATPHEMGHLLSICLNQPWRGKTPGYPQPSKDSRHSLAIFPGTKWCGAGNVAMDGYDLGEARYSDMCCRDHDHSNDTITPLGEKYGIKNRRLYTMTNCAEDRKLFNCFLKVGSFTSVSLGITFFDILKTRCFEYGYPTMCARYKIPGKKRCAAFAIDTSKRRRWRVYRPPNFFQTFTRAMKRKSIAEELWISEDMQT